MDDPVAAARWVEENLDIAELSRELFAKVGPAAAPGALLRLTPLELITLFTRPKDDADGIDRAAELHRVNHAVRATKGLAPAVPTWLMPKVPRDH